MRRRLTNRRLQVARRQLPDVGPLLREITEADPPLARLLLGTALARKIQQMARRHARPRARRPDRPGLRGDPDATRRRIRDVPLLPSLHVQRPRRPRLRDESALRRPCPRTFFPQAMIRFEHLADDLIAACVPPATSSTRRSRSEVRERAAKPVNPLRSQALLGVLRRRIEGARAPARRRDRRAARLRVRLLTRALATTRSETVAKTRPWTAVARPCTVSDRASGVRHVRLSRAPEDGFDVHRLDPERPVRRAGRRRQARPAARRRALQVRVRLHSQPVGPLRLTVVLRLPGGGKDAQESHAAEPCRRPPATASSWPPPARGHQADRALACALLEPHSPEKFRRWLVDVHTPWRAAQFEPAFGATRMRTRRWIRDLSLLRCVHVQPQRRPRRVRRSRTSGRPCRRTTSPRR